MDVRASDTTLFYNGIDAGPIQAAEDTYQQLIDQNITDALSAGDQVGYTFAVDNNAVVEVSAEADGSGGTQNRTVNIKDNFETSQGRVKSVNEETLSGQKNIETIDSEHHFLDPDGSGRVVQLPAASAGRTYTIRNTGSSGSDLDVQNDSSTTVTTLSNGDVAEIMYSGTAWYIV